MVVAKGADGHVDGHADEGAAGAPGWQIVWSEAPLAKPGARISKKRAQVPLQALGFKLDELRDARLAPIVSFKGRGEKGALSDTAVATDD